MIEPNDVVLVTAGPHKGRIGFCDDEESSKTAIIYFGNMFFADGYFYIQKRFLKLATIADLITRKEAISAEINSFVNYGNPRRYDATRYLLFAEYNLIESTLYERDLFVRYGKSSKGGKKIFIAHSKKDRWFANRLTDDLKLLGHDPWLDEIKIKAGDSIPEGIQKGLEEAHYQVVILSSNSNQSQWVKVEWMSKFWEEVQKRKTIIIPALIEECEIPHLLKTKKYANFTESYDEGLGEIIHSISRK